MKDAKAALDQLVSRKLFIRGGIGVVAGGFGFNGVGSLLSTGQTAFKIPHSPGYLVVDDKLCGECKICMTACSLYNEGEANLSLSRIQVIANPMFTRFGVDQCRRCVGTPCVDVCPTSANYINAELNMRVIDKSKCIGCMRCQSACPYTFARLPFDRNDQKMRKCNLCDGNPKCVRLCPNGAIKFLTNEAVSSKLADEGQKVRLRHDYPWAQLKWSTE